MMDLIELQHRLQENRNRNLQVQQQEEQQQSEYRLWTAAIEEKKKRQIQAGERERDIIRLLDEGHNIEETAYILAYLRSEVAHVAESQYYQGRSIFLRTGKMHLPGQVAGISIFQ